VGNSERGYRWREEEWATTSVMRSGLDIDMQRRRSQNDRVKEHLLQDHIHNCKTFYQHDMIVCSGSA
jgi:hypothetical protein